jgi:ComF family protein
VCAADYAFPWDGLITAFKFHGHVELAGALSNLMVAAVRASAAPLPQRVLPVPLAHSRLAERGYNQAWELARRAARTLQLPAHGNVLWRHLDTAHQVALGRQERQQNLRTAFMVNPKMKALIQGQHLALVDDVMTTGATVSEACAVLLRAGAARVDVWVLARTPED